MYAFFVRHFLLLSFYLDPKWHRGWFYEVGSVRPSILELLVFSKFWHGTRDTKLFVTVAKNFWKFFFWHKNWESGPKMGQKQGFLNLLKNVVINFGP